MRKRNVHIEAWPSLPGERQEREHFIGTALALGLAGLSAAGALGGAAIQSNAAKSAAQTQANAGNQAINFQQGIFNQQQKNQQPFLDAGQQSIGQLMQALQSGKFGPGSTGQVPQFTGGTFAAPTLDEARATPGYQFTAQQGSKGILQGAAAAGGAISGGTLKALDTFNTGLADSTYNDVFNRSLSTYNEGLSKYQAQLQGYGAGLAGQQQEFNQLFAPAQLGENASANINQTGTQLGQSVGNLMTGIGNATAAGQVGSANALSSGISGATNGILQSILFKNLFGGTGKALPGTVGGNAVPPSGNFSDFLGGIPPG